MAAQVAAAGIAHHPRLHRGATLSAKHLYRVGVPPVSAKRACSSASSRGRCRAAGRCMVGAVQRPLFNDLAIGQVAHQALAFGRVVRLQVAALLQAKQ